MDPTNTNQNDNQVPAAPAAPSVASATPVTPATPVTQVTPVTPVAPVTPEAPAAPVAPVAPESPAAPVAPVAPESLAVATDSAASLDSAVSAASPMPANPNVSMPTIDPSLIEQGAENADFNMATEAPDVMMGATDPVTMPNPPKAPDPIEEELKAPMTAAAPVPGSIGSAISMPAEQPMNDGEMSAAGMDMGTKPRTPNVAFNDPANFETTQAKAASPVAPVKKKIDKKTLIMLCGIAGIAVVALVIVLVMMLNQ